MRWSIIIFWAKVISWGWSWLFFLSGWRGGQGNQSKFPINVDSLVLHSNWANMWIFQTLKPNLNFPPVKLVRKFCSSSIRWRAWMQKRAGSRQIQLIRPGEKHLEYMTKRLGAVRGREIHKITIIPISSVVNISASSAPGWSHKRKAALRASNIFQLECATDNHHLNANLFSAIMNLPGLICF